MLSLSLSASFSLLPIGIRQVELQQQQYQQYQQAGSLKVLRFVQGPMLTEFVTLLGCNIVRELLARCGFPQE